MGKSYVCKDFWGNEYVAHYDDEGNLSGKSYNCKDYWGNEYVAHYDNQGNQIGKSYETKDFWGNDRVSHYDNHGNLIGRSYDTKDFWGNDQVSHYDSNGNRIGTSCKAVSFFGNEYISHSGEGSFFTKSKREEETEEKEEETDTLNQTSTHVYSGSSSYMSFADFLPVFFGITVLIIIWNVLKAMFSFGKNMTGAVISLLEVPRSFFFDHYLLITIVLTVIVWILLLYNYVSLKNKSGKTTFGYILSAVFVIFSINLLLNPASYLFINRQNKLNPLLVITLALMILYMPYIVTIIWKYSLKAIMGKEYFKSKRFFAKLFEWIIYGNAIAYGLMASSDFVSILGVELLYCLPLKVTIDHLGK